MCERINQLRAGVYHLYADDGTQRLVDLGIVARFPYHKVLTVTGFTWTWTWTREHTLPRSSWRDVARLPRERSPTLGHDRVRASGAVLAGMAPGLERIEARGTGHEARGMWSWYNRLLAEGVCGNLKAPPALMRVRRRSCLRTRARIGRPDRPGGCPTRRPPRRHPTFWAGASQYSQPG